jgi:Rrf2 family protein
VKQLSRRCKYALRALYRLNRNYAVGPLAVIEIAERDRIPRKFLEAILVQLRNAGIVASQMGKRGGYRLAKHPENITIGAIIRAMDGPLTPMPCVSDKPARTCDECVALAVCETHLIMKQVRDAMAEVLDHTTLAQACEQRHSTILTYEI